MANHAADKTSSPSTLPLPALCLEPRSPTPLAPARRGTWWCPCQLAPLATPSPRRRRVTNRRGAARAGHMSVFAARGRLVKPEHMPWWAHGEESVTGTREILRVDDAGGQAQPPWLPEQAAAASSAAPPGHQGRQQRTPALYSGNSIYRARGCQPSRRRSREAQKSLRSFAVLFGCSVRWTWHRFFLSFYPAHLILFHFLLGRSILIQHMFSYQFVSYSVLDFLPKRWYGICRPHFTIILILLID